MDPACRLDVAHRVPIASIPGGSAGQEGALGKAGSDPARSQAQGLIPGAKPPLPSCPQSLPSLGWQVQVLPRYHSCCQTIGLSTASAVPRPLHPKFIILAGILSTRSQGEKRASPRGRGTSRARNSDSEWKRWHGLRGPVVPCRTKRTRNSLLVRFVGTLRNVPIKSPKWPKFGTFHGAIKKHAISPMPGNRTA